MNLELQRKLLGDAVRNKAFYEALKRALEAGASSVLDIGSGTGFLSFLARKLGAEDCTLIEASPLIELSRKLAKSNGFTDFRFHHKLSYDVSLKESMDLVVCETLGNLAFEENLIESLADASRFLKKGGSMIPCQVSVETAPVTSRRLWDDVNIWDRIGYELTFAEAKDISLENVYVREIQPSDLESVLSPQEIDRVLFPVKNAKDKSVSRRQSACEWEIGKPTDFYGLAMWWCATLVPGVELSTSPFRARTHWDQTYFPIKTPQQLKKGQILKFEVISDSRLTTGFRIQWQIEIRNSKSGKPIYAEKADSFRGHDFD